ncbi:MAG: hypothetical protein KKG92_05700 [Gammaproteobacteria bacterium]|nr:hypothetical protein [Gammaproteobacteria bacterium]
MHQRQVEEQHPVTRHQFVVTARRQQAAYRVRKLKEGDGERLQAIISLHAKRAQERLARNHGATQAALLERLILEEQKRVTAGMDSDQHRAYIGELAA